MRHSDDDIEAAAEYLCVQLHPDEIRSDYVRNIRVHYHAEEIVYVLQALSSGMTALFVGLLTNHLYDKTKKPDQNLKQLSELLHEQNASLRKLEAILKKKRDPEFAEIAEKHRALHHDVICRVQDSDPEIRRMVDDVLAQLEARGRQALSDDVDSHFP